MAELGVNQFWLAGWLALGGIVSLILCEILRVSVF